MDVEAMLRNRVRQHLAESSRVKQALISGAGANSRKPLAVAAGLPFAAEGGSPAALDGPGERSVRAMVSAAKVIAGAFQSGGKLLLCGNGGSAADCQHLAAEFMNLLSKDFIRSPLPAIALTTDTSYLTAFANDFRASEDIFARQVRALGRPGDVLIAISTSGTSPNVLKAVEVAAAAKLKTIALTGEGGMLANRADTAICVPSTDTHHIQEAHLAIEHAICGLVEELIFKGDRNGQHGGAFEPGAV